jgi:hypothetical protein
MIVQPQQKCESEDKIMEYALHKVCLNPRNDAIGYQAVFPCARVQPILHIENMARVAIKGHGLLKILPLRTDTVEGSRRLLHLRFRDRWRQRGFRRRGDCWRLRSRGFRCGGDCWGLRSRGWQPRGSSVETPSRKQFIESILLALPLLLGLQERLL